MLCLSECLRLYTTKMQASTPNRPKLNGDLRRTSMIANATAALLTPLRTNAVGKKDAQQIANLSNGPLGSSPLRRKATAPQPAHCELQTINDETERTKRRSDITIQKRMSNIATSGSITWTDADVIRDIGTTNQHIKLCNKLFAENKISGKVVWELRIIDIIHQLTSGTIKTDNVMQTVGTTLDVGAKIYGIRVDDAHVESLKIASGIAKKAKATIDQDEMGVENVEKEKPTAVRKKKKRKDGRKSTIDYEGNNVFGELTRIECFSFATKDSGASDVDNFFINKIPVNPVTGKYVLLNDDKYWASNDSKTLVNKNKDNMEYPDLPEITVKDYTLCHPFKSFNIGNWAPENEEMPMAADEVVLDEDGLPIAELDGSIHDIFVDHSDDEPISDVEEHHADLFQAQIQGGATHIVNAIPEESRNETEFGYNTLLRTSTGQVIDKIWAGPSHWKLKYIRPSTSRYTGTVVAQQAAVKSIRKRAKVYQRLTFEVQEFDMNSIYVSKGVRPTATAEKITLPMLCDFNSGLELKPSVVCKNHFDSKADHDYKVQTYNYDNPNDSLYCSQNGTDDLGADNESGDGSIHEDVAIAAQGNFLEDQLVDAPDLVPNCDIPYALHAKKMDMSKLKSAIWKILTVHNIHNKDESLKFSNLFLQLRDDLNAEMRKELSCGLVFTALLHLCNEHSLELDPIENNDFLIKRVL